MKTDLVTYFFIVAGLFATLAAALDWDFFLNARKARAFVALLGRGGARVFYGLLGMTLVVLGILLATGLIAGPEGRLGR